MRNSYKIIPENCLIIESYYGDFSLTEFIKLKWKQVHDPLYQNTFNYILDFQKVHFTNRQKYQDILFFLELYIEQIQSNKCAIVTSNPNQVVQSVLLTLEAEKILPVSFKIFSDISHAEKWTIENTQDFIFPKINLTKN